MELDKALERYLRHHRAEGSTPKTLDYHRVTISLFHRFLLAQQHPVSIESLHADYVREWVEEQRGRGLAQKTLATRVKSLKAFMRWLVEEEWLSRDPLAKLRVPKVDVQAKPTLSICEVEALLRTCDRGTLTGARDFAIMLLLFSTGLRAAELIALRVEDFDWQQGLVRIRRGKGGKFRVVPLGSKVDKAIDKYLEYSQRKRQGQDFVFLTDEGEPLTYVVLRHMLVRRGNKAGVKANPHKWRHSAAVHYLRSGGRLETLRAMLGHTDFEMTLHYARIAGVDLATAHETCDPVRSLRVRV